MSEIRLRGRLRVYACGGAGINIGRKLEEFRNNPQPGSADITISYIDTSRSNLANLPEQVLDKNCYLLEGLDGSGKIRRENHESIRDNTRKILQAFPPEDINVVISSGPGGSGSVIAPSILAELLENDQQVVVLMIGATDSAIEIENTLKTLKSYEAISQKKERPVVTSYFQNSKETPRELVDVSAVQVVLAIATVFSRQNLELDTRDLYNFLNYHRVPGISFTPKLVGLSVQVGPIADDRIDDVCSVAMVTVPGADDSLPFTPEYKTVGYLPADVDANLLKATPLTLMTHSNFFEGVAKELDGRLEDVERAKKARLASKSIIGVKDIATDDGMVL